MSSFVLRFTLRPSREPQELQLPNNARVLSAAVKPHDTAVSLWALCSEGETEVETRRFWCVGTGPSWKLPERSLLNYIGTCTEAVLVNGHGYNVLVWHVFEEMSMERAIAKVLNEAMP